MIIRYGFYEGQVRAERQAEFDAHFRNVVIPGLARMPGIISVRLLRGYAQGSVQPRFHHIIELTCRDENALIEAMLSDQRRALQAGPWEVMDFYEGATPHGNFIVAMTLEGPGAVQEGPPPLASRRTPIALARVGRAGQEKPVAVYDDGEIRDVSIFVSEIDRGLINADWGPAIAALDSGRMPWVDPAARKGPCLEYRGRIIATDIPGPQPGNPLRAALRAGRLAGANDPMSLPRGHAFTCRAGIAAIIGGGLPEPSVGGVCLFLAAETLGKGGLDAETRAVVASSSDLISLGPLLVDVKNWRPGAGAVRMSINGAEVEEVAAGTEIVQEAVQQLNRQVELECGDVVLVGAQPPDRHAGQTALQVGDVVAVEARGLGAQERRCC